MSFKIRGSIHIFAKVSGSLGIDPACLAQACTQYFWYATGTSSDAKFWCHHTQQILAPSEACISLTQLRLLGLSHEPVAAASLVSGMGAAGGAEQHRIQKCLKDAVGVAARKQQPSLHVCSKLKVGQLS
jgi:hypothetical protein